MERVLNGAMSITTSNQTHANHLIRRYGLLKVERQLKFEHAEPRSAPVGKQAGS